MEICALDTSPGETETGDDESSLLELSNTTKQKLRNLSELQKSDSALRAVCISSLATGVLPDEG